MSYPVISISGNASERGRQYGVAVSDRIRNTIAFYKEMFRTYGVSWQEAQKRAESFIPYIRDYFSEGLEEMQGIARGAELDFADILAINCRSEILFAFPDGCSCIGTLSAMTKDGHVYLAQNWDWLRAVDNCVVIVKIEQPRYPRMIMCAEAGIIGGKGLNDAGIGVCLNALSVGRGKPGVPLHVIYRKILTQTSISNALGVIASANRAGSGNFALGSSQDFLLNVEFTPDNFDVSAASETKPLLHTNHYLSSIFKAEDTFKHDLPDTFIRLNRLERLTASLTNKLNRETILSILRDHKNEPDSICSHEDPNDPPGKRLCTIYAVVLDLTEKCLWITEGCPCSSEATQVNLSD